MVEARRNVLSQMARWAETELYFHPENHYFWDLIKKFEADKILDALSKVEADEIGLVNRDVVIAVVRNAVGAGSASNELVEAEKIHAVMRAYLKVTKKSYIDVVSKYINEAVASLSKNLFERFRLTDERLSVLLNEDSVTVNKRTVLTKRLHICNLALVDFKESHF